MIRNILKSQLRRDDLMREICEPISCRWSLSILFENRKKKFNIAYSKHLRGNVNFSAIEKNKISKCFNQNFCSRFYTSIIFFVENKFAR